MLKRRICLLLGALLCSTVLMGDTHEVVERGAFIGEWWHPLPGSVVQRVVGRSWKEDCPVPLDDLAYVQVSHWGLDEALYTGELVYHKNLAAEIVEIFADLYDAHFPIEKMILIDDYQANDDLSMEDNNSSAFCSRAITGKVGVYSLHSYGGAIDINPFLNPYVNGEIVLPRGSDRYVSRDQQSSGMIVEGDACYRAFAKRGYLWGGNWRAAHRDYQHFEKEPSTFISNKEIPAN